MEFHFLVLIIFGLVGTSLCSNVSQNLGATGRYCYQGWDDGEGSYNFKQNVWCGLHPVKYPGCVYIISPSNYVTMGCGNDGGDIPACYDENSGCSMQGDDYVCCCTSDNCNDCPTRMQECRYPVVPTTTTRKPVIHDDPTVGPSNNNTFATTTPKTSAGVSAVSNFYGLIVTFVFVCVLILF